jgi:hypothetical protein
LQGSFESLPQDTLYKVRIALAPNAAARMAQTSRSMHAIFQPRANADHLWHRAANPELDAAPPRTTPELIGHYVDLMRQAEQLPEDLRPPILNEILWQASWQMEENSVGIEDVALAYLRATGSVIDRQARCALLCDFGRMLEMPRFRRQCMDPDAPPPTRPTVDALASEFAGRCLRLGFQATRSTGFPESMEALPEAARKSLVARQRWKEHIETDPSDCVRLNAAVLSSLFMMPAAVRVTAWKKMARMCELYPAEARAPLLQALSTIAPTIGAGEECVTAIRHSVRLMQGQDAATQAMVVGNLIISVQGSADPVLKNGASQFLTTEVNKLPAQFRWALFEPLVAALPSIDDQHTEAVLDLLLSKVSELPGADQAEVVASLCGALRAHAPGQARLTMFDMLWRDLPNFEPGCRAQLRNDLVHAIRTLPSHVRLHRFFQAVGDAEKLRGAELSTVLPQLLRNTSSLGIAAVAATGFCDIAAMVGRLPIEEQALQLRTLYDFVTRVPQVDVAYAFLTLLDRAAARLDDGERVVLIGTAAARTAWLPLPMFADQLDSLVAQANELAPAMRDQAYGRIEQALTDALGTPGVETDPVRSVMFPTIVHGIRELPLVMRVPLLVAAARALERRGDFPDRRWIRELIANSANELPSESRRQLQQLLEEANCRSLLGYV